MALNKYQVFLKVAETQNLTKAADELRYTQPAISHIIKGLEEELGVQLVYRNKSGIRLTPFAEKLLPDIKMIVKHETSVFQTAGMLRGIEIGDISVGSFSSVSLQWMPSIILEMQQRYPKVNVHQTHRTYRDIENLLKEDRVDCGFLTEKRHEAFDFIPLIKDEYKVVLPRDHYLSEYERVPIQALSNEDFILMYEGAEYYDTGNILAGASPNIRHTVEDDLVALPLVERGLGITVLPQLLLECTAANVVQKSFAVPRYRTIGLAAKSFEDAPPLVNLFVKLVQEYIKNGTFPDEKA